jgi:hypothetical protein
MRILVLFLGQRMYWELLTSFRCAALNRELDIPFRVMPLRQLKPSITLGELTANPPAFHYQLVSLYRDKISFISISST